MLSSFIPLDRRNSLANQQPLAEQLSGTVLFVDVSGYSRLTEKLMREAGRKVGAEAMTRQINIVFDQLIGEVHKFGGSIINFSGDALTCWFSDDDGERVVGCGLSMRAESIAFEQLQFTDEITASVQVKIVIVSGTVRRFLTGDRTIQQFDLIAGLPIRKMALGETLAEAGDLLIADLLANHPKLDLEIIEWRKTMGHRFAVIGDANAEPVVGQSVIDPRPDLSEQDIHQWVLRSIREKLRQSDTFVGEFRHAIALFIQFDGIDYDNDLEADTLLDSYIRSVQAILGAYQGNLIKVTIGDKGSYLLAVFGAPLNTDEPSGKAIAAAMQLRNFSRQMGLDQIRIGIGQGWLLAGIFGNQQRRTYDVLGHDVNLANQMMQRAKFGEILVSHQVARETDTNFTFEQRYVDVKWSQEPVEAFNLLGYRSALATNPLLFGRNIFVIGREAELDQLHNAWSATCQEGSGRIIHLSGVSGSGKSELLRYFVSLVTSDAICLTTVCHSYTQHQPFSICGPLLHTVLGLPPNRTTSSIEEIDAQKQQLRTAINLMNPAWNIDFPLLCQVVGLDVEDNEVTGGYDAQQRRKKLTSLLVGIILAASEKQPLLLAVDDVHWIDDDSKAVLSELQDKIPSRAILLIRVETLERPPVVEESDVTAIHLTGLTPNSLSDIVQHRYGLPASKLLASLLFTYSDGNPFFVEELLFSLDEMSALTLTDQQVVLARNVFDQLHRTGCLRLVDGVWDLDSKAMLRGLNIGLAENIFDIERARLDRLSEEQRQVIEVACAAGQIIEFDLLVITFAGTLAKTELLNILAQLAERRLIHLLSTHNITYTFRHHIIRQVAYETLLTEYQRELHQRVGEALAVLRPSAVAELAHHFNHADPKGKGLVYEARHLVYRGEFSQASAVARAALDYFQQAADQIGQAMALSTLALVARRQGKLSEATTNYERALVGLPANSSNRSERLQIVDGLGMTFLDHGQYQEAKTHFETMLTLAQETSDRRVEAKALSNLGLTSYYERNLEQALDLLDHSLAIRKEIGDRDGQKSSLINFGMAIRDYGDYSQAVTHLEQALIMAKESHDTWDESVTTNELGVLYLMIGDYRTARVYFDAALLLSKKLGDEFGVVIALGNLGVVDREIGQLGSAKTQLLECLNRSQFMNMERLEGLANSYLATVSLATGLFRQAREQALRAIDLREDEEGRLYATMDYTTLIRIYLQQQRLNDALAAANEAVAILDGCNGKGPEFPHHDYFYCYLAFAANDELQMASYCLRNAHRIMTTQAALITDEGMSASFLGMAVNQQIANYFADFQAGEQ